MALLQIQKNKIDTLFVIGSKEINPSLNGETVTINVGFKPSVIFVYSSKNQQINFGSDIYPGQCAVPTILADINLTSTQPQASEITNNGFQTQLRNGSSGWSSITHLFYIAFKDLPNGKIIFHNNNVYYKGSEMYYFLTSQNSMYKLVEFSYEGKSTQPVSNYSITFDSVIKCGIIYIVGYTNENKDYTGTAYINSHSTSLGFVDSNNIARGYTFISSLGTVLKISGSSGYTFWSINGFMFIQR